ncbi:hypothetical protein HU200_045692 [Digitaria exilis]|uniref:Uncharacterized protein n=1 Tax=Digitaria exilis TaxID=1010633 RepID=A0A835B7F6_9POAL|nr:hypothetical protein HU200_045692 [Digitaria exilis]
MLRFWRRPSLPLKLAFTISLAVSFSVSCCAAPSSPSSHTSASSRSPPPSSKAVAADLLSVLGGPRAAERVPPAEASRLHACLRFLSPVNPAASKVSSWGARKFLLEGLDVGAAEADEMVKWPPAPVMELARLAVDSGGDPGAIHRALDPTMLPVPDVEGSQENKCELTRTTYGRRFANKVHSSNHA